jgi:glycosyltransferase involved in cell wall biosynthesis
LELSDNLARFQVDFGFYRSLRRQMLISVLIPSYRRPADLLRCLAGIGAQVRPPDQILVVARTEDDETIKIARTWGGELPLEIVEVGVSGQVYALNAGLESCRGDVVAITDDDAAPRPEWLARIEGHFASDPKIGGVGGRDWIYNDGVLDSENSDVVGRVLWFGRVVGNHHRGTGPVRDVDILKGANCSFRMAAIKPIGFDTQLRGAGAQVHNDMLISLAVRRAGWRLIYDPKVTVDHYLGKRHDIDQRGKLNRDATVDRAYNLRLALGEVVPDWRRTAALLWQLVVGTREAPGLVWLWRHSLHGRKNILTIYRATLAGWRQASNESKNRSVRDLA